MISKRDGMIKWRERKEGLKGRKQEMEEKSKKNSRLSHCVVMISRRMDAGKRE